MGSAENEHRIDGARSTPNDLISSPRRFISDGAAGVGWLLPRARIQHLRLFSSGVDLLGIEARRYGRIREVHRFRLLADEQYACHVILLHLGEPRRAGQLRFRG